MDEGLTVELYLDARQLLESSGFSVNVHEGKIFRVFTTAAPEIKPLFSTGDVKHLNTFAEGVHLGTRSGIVIDMGN